MKKKVLFLLFVMLCVTAVIYAAPPMFNPNDVPKGPAGESFVHWLVRTVSDWF